MSASKMLHTEKIGQTLYHIQPTEKQELTQEEEIFLLKARLRLAWKSRNEG